MTLQDPRAGAAPQGRRTIPLAEVTLPHHCPRPVRMTVLDRSPYFHDLGAEALARWSCDACGEVPPLEFIPLLEESGLIVPFGAWVLRRAMETAARWRASPSSPRGK